VSGCLTLYPHHYSLEACQSSNPKAERVKTRQAPPQITTEETKLCLDHRHPHRPKKSLRMLFHGVNQLILILLLLDYQRVGH
jgi:hypothetical protein